MSCVLLVNIGPQAHYAKGLILFMVETTILGMLLENEK